MTDFGFGAGTVLPETSHGHDFPVVSQFSLFYENRIGVLRQMLSEFSDIDARIVAMNILETSDSAIIRLVFDHSEVARDTMLDRQLRYIEAELLVVAMPDSDDGLMSICSALFAGEVNILYAYPLLVRPLGRQAMALRVDNIEMAAATLEKRRFTLVDEASLRHGY